MLETSYRFGEVNKLSTQIEPSDEKVQFKPVFNNAHGGVALLGFKAGQKLDEHLSPAELMVTVIEGEIVFTVIDKPHTLRAGEFLLVGEGVPHRVVANADSKVMLTKIKA